MIFRLREWEKEVADLPLWLFEESHSVVDDLDETIAALQADAQATLLAEMGA